MNYNKNNLKKNKIIQFGGNGIQNIINNIIPSTQSWIYMPILLAPFDDIITIFDPIIDKTLIQYNLPSFENMIKKVKEFYVEHKVDLSSYKELENFGYKFDNTLHLLPNNQESLLKYIKINEDIDIIIYVLHMQYEDNDTNWHLIKNILIDKKFYFGSIDDNFIDPTNNMFLNKNYFNYDDGTIVSINIAILDSKFIINNKRKISKFLMNNNIDVVIKDIEDLNFQIKNQGLFIFGSFNDEFKALYTYFKNYKGFIIYFVDRKNNWFNKLISAYILTIIDFANHVDNYIFIGGSMGGYGALHVSVYFPEKKKICIAITPQTINYTYYENKIFINKNEYLEKKPHVLSCEYIYKNIPQVLSERSNYNTKIYLLTGKSECNNMLFGMDFIYLDLLHAGAIVNYPNVNIIIFNFDTHVLIIHLDLVKLMNIFENNFDLLFDNQNDGSKLLNDNILRV